MDWRQWQLVLWNLPELSVELEEDFPLAGGGEIGGAGQRLEVQRLALGDVHLEFFGNLWTDLSSIGMKLYFFVAEAWAKYPRAFVLGRFFRLVYYLQVSQEVSQRYAANVVRNIRLAWNNFPGTNTVACFSTASVTKESKFYDIDTKKCRVSSLLTGPYLPRKLKNSSAT